MEMGFRDIFNPKKKNNRVIVVLMVILALSIGATLVACSSASVTDKDNPTEDKKIFTEDGEIAVTRLYDGKTAIITEDIEIYDAYVVDFQDIDGVEDQSKLTLVKIEPKVDEPFKPLLLRKNDIILVLEEADKYCRIFVPYGTPATLRGKVDRNAISYDTGLFAGANQAVINNVTGYDGINGNEIGQKSGRGTIIKRNDGWALITLPGGDNVFWVKESILSFDFDMQIEDVDPYQVR